MDGGDHKNGTHEPLAGALFYILLGPIVWAIHLTLVYLGHTLLCALGVSFGALAPGVVSFSVIIVTAVALIVLTVAVVAANFRWRALDNRGSDAMFFRDRDHDGVGSVVRLWYRVGGRKRADHRALSDAALTRRCLTVDSTIGAGVFSSLSGKE